MNRYELLKRKKQTYRKTNKIKINKKAIRINHNSCGIYLCSIELSLRFLSFFLYFFHFFLFHLQLQSYNFFYCFYFSKKNTKKYKERRKEMKWKALHSMGFVEVLINITTNTVLLYTKASRLWFGSLVTLRYNGIERVFFFYSYTIVDEYIPNCFLVSLIYSFLFHWVIKSFVFLAFYSFSYQFPIYIRPLTLNTQIKQRNSN